jgi:hypothetical protein
MTDHEKLLEATTDSLHSVVSIRDYLIAAKTGAEIAVGMLDKIENRLIEALEAIKGLQEGTMSIYVVEINGVGIAAVNASSLEAIEFFHGEPFKADLQCLTGENGKDLWDGKQEIYVREAFPEQYAKWQSAHDRALSQRALSQEGDDEDELYVVFLVPVQ